MSLVNFYKIVCNDSGAVYVGSTTQTIEKRLRKHKYNYSYYLENKYNYNTSFFIIEKNNYTIQLIESVICNDKKHRDILETLHILNENSINKMQPGRDEKKYYIDNKEKIKEKNKQWRGDNKEKLKECAKQNYQNNKENVKERHRQYYHNNKERLNMKYNCECGGKYVYTSKSKHMKSNKHLNYLTSL